MSEMLPENYMIVTQEDIEIQRCMTYLQMKEQRKTLDEIGTYFGYKSRQGMANQRDRWQEDGIMDKAKAKFFIPKGEEINAARGRVMQEVPAMLDRLVKIVKLGKERNAIEAYKLLHDTLINPELNKQPEESNAEQGYAARAEKGLPNPMVVMLPSPQPEDRLEVSLEVPDTVSVQSQTTVQEETSYPHS